MTEGMSMVKFSSYNQLLSSVLISEEKKKKKKTKTKTKQKTGEGNCLGLTNTAIVPGCYLYGSHAAWQE